MQAVRRTHALFTYQHAKERRRALSNQGGLSASHRCGLLSDGQHAHKEHSLPSLRRWVPHNTQHMPSHRQPLARAPAPPPSRFTARQSSARTRDAHTAWAAARLATRGVGVTRAREHSEVSRFFWSGIRPGGGGGATRPHARVSVWFRPCLQSGPMRAQKHAALAHGRFRISLSTRGAEGRRLAARRGEAVWSVGGVWVVCGWCVGGVWVVCGWCGVWVVRCVGCGMEGAGWWWCVHAGGKGRQLAGPAGERARWEGQRRGEKCVACERGGGGGGGGVGWRTCAWRGATEGGVHEGRVARVHAQANIVSSFSRTARARLRGMSHAKSAPTRVLISKMHIEPSCRSL